MHLKHTTCDKYALFYKKPVYKKVGTITSKIARTPETLRHLGHFKTILSYRISSNQHQGR